MFTKSNWSVLSFNNSSEAFDVFSGKADNEATLLATSQYAASAICRCKQFPSVGLNPFLEPRLDEIVAPKGNVLEILAAWVSMDADKRGPMPVEVEKTGVYATDLGMFRIGSEQKYGFWVVLNEFKDNNHIASVKEGMAYDNYMTPYKALSSDYKTELDVAATPKTSIARKQFPVILDFNRGYMYVENTSKNVVLEVISLFTVTFGLEFNRLGWLINQNGWLFDLLTKLLQDTQYVREFEARAEEAKSAPLGSIEPWEDDFKENLVKKYFALNSLEDGSRVTLAGPVQTNLFKTSEVITVKQPTDVTRLASEFSQMTLQSARLGFHEEIEVERKGVLKRQLIERMSFDFNISIALVEAGAIILKGVDFPRFIKGIRKEQRRTKRILAVWEWWERYLEQLNLAVDTQASFVKEMLELPEGEGLMKLEPIKDSNTTE